MDEILEQTEVIREEVIREEVIRDLSELVEMLANGSQTPNCPKIIFFDAVGTLFGVRDGVGVQYAKVADRFGVTVSPQELDTAFYAAFKQAGSPSFPSASAEAIPQLERDWWRSIVLETFDRVGVLPEFDQFDPFFEAVFQHFASDQPWIVYPETLTVLAAFRSLEIPLGILSNFDSRIYGVLRSLGLDHYFQSVTISTESGAAKPNPKIFQIAIAKHHCEARDAWHVGDSRKEDFEASIALGLRGIWLCRSGLMP